MRLRNELHMSLRRERQQRMFTDVKIPHSMSYPTTAVYWEPLCSGSSLTSDMTTLWVPNSVESWITLASNEAHYCTCSAPEYTSPW